MKTGFFFRQEDGSLSSPSSGLLAIIDSWQSLEQWWLLIRSRLTLPAPTQCPVCGMAQRLGEEEVTLSNGKQEHVFDISFIGHAHEITLPQTGDMLLVHEVTDERSRFKKLSAEVLQYESLCKAIEDVYFRIDLNGLIQFISPSSYKLMRYRPEELRGCSLKDLCATLDNWLELLEIFEKTDIVEDFDVVLKCQKGHQIPVSMNARLVFDARGNRVGIEGILRDITEREQMDTLLAERTRKMQESLVKLENLKRALDQHALVSITDSEGRITYVNEWMVKVSQYSWEELIGQGHRKLNSDYHPKSFFKEMWRIILSGGVWRGEICNRRKDGGEFWVDCTIFPIMTPSGKPFQFIAISTEISNRIQIEQRLQGNRDFLLGVTDAMGEGVYVLDLHGRFCWGGVRMNCWAAIYMN
ncbi:MAG: PAS domain S-box protein [Magnetococcus sp. DMHC-6]